ncbi:helix-turn-helix transcriptional regulator [Microbacterium sp.]|jgi:AraC family transcriptional regulator|uniref:helix-turn-helix transcriptional regulator n=2 Tax=Micrococcales TaxID=85006 RepID=UPI0009AE0852|nr:helix-turn-helix transcriptional regulator [Microbacterium sp.]GLU58322.1 hypothetical protein Pure01_08350 [Paenarthrobacter ureafaciens]GLU62968.1 hypothetical protein Pure02_12180 [Paenarthrobacter ureafaciens]GLU67242.1 hypothetical protein Pure03_12180 [Paenarthrobacter ureafaciens]GLU71154.1 hypothetical protein Pure04_08690 [Paenarthrobacter ureafaciens]
MARHHVLKSATERTAYREIKIVAVRSGSLRVLVDNYETLAHTGDITVLPAETVFHVVPVPQASITCIYLDPEYALDLVYWQYRGRLSHRAEAHVFAERLYGDMRIIVRLGKRLKKLAPILDGMVALSRTSDFVIHSNQMQAHWFTLANAISRSIGGPEAFPPAGSDQRLRATRPTPIRPEVLKVETLLRERPEFEWTLRELARRVSLSPGHLSTLCTRAWGYPPRTRLQLIRVEMLARLLQETDSTVEHCIHLVGWRSSSHASKLFRTVMQVSPHEYRIARRRDTSVTLGAEIVGLGARSEAV